MKKLLKSLDSLEDHELYLLMALAGVGIVVLFVVIHGKIVG